MLDELGGSTVGDALLAPTRIYVRPVLKLLAKYRVKQVVHAMAHITGGGLPGNVPRVLPTDCNAVLKKSSWPRPRSSTSSRRPARSRRRRCSTSSTWASATS